MTLIRFNGDHVQVVEVDIDRDFKRQEIARVFVRRELLSEDDVERGQTEILVVEDEEQDAEDAEFGGILRDIDQQGSVTELIIESFERLGRDGTPTPGGERFENVADSDIVNDAIDSIPELEVGTVETVQSPMSKVFSHTSQAKKIRSTADSSGAELVYRSDKTVDYLIRRGEDRTDEEISPSEQNIKGDFEAEKLSAEEDITHLRLVGAGEGVHQRVVSFVPEDDSFDWESELDHPVERYNADHYDDGDRNQWHTKASKDQTDLDGLTRLGEVITEDVQTRNIEVVTTLEGIDDVKIGDEFTVTYPEENILNEEMRVVELEKKINIEGEEFDVTLSTRRESRSPDEEFDEAKDLSNYNLAIEGTSVSINTSGGRQPVTSSDNYFMRLYYPDEVAFEHRLNVRVMGLPYRAYSSGAADGGGVADTTSAGGFTSSSTGVSDRLTDAEGSAGNLDSDTFLSPGDDVDWERENAISFSGHVLWLQVDFITEENTSVPVTVEVTFINPGEDFERRGFAIGGALTDGFGAFKITVPVFGVENDADILTTVANPDWSDESFTIDSTLAQTNYIGGDHEHDFVVPDHTHDVDLPDHTHDPEPGLVEFSSFLPEDCQVLVNGSSVGGTFGSGTEFSESVDIRGELNPGAVNEVEVSSETTGHIQAFVEGDVYRQILGDG